MSDSKADVIAKLLAKAQGKGISPEEAALFSAKAEELMIKHGIDQALIDARRAAQGGVKEAIIKDYVNFTGTYKQAFCYMASSVLRGFGTMRGYYVDMGSSFVFTIVGFESDVAQAKTLITSLQLQCFSAQSVWWKNFDDKAWMSPMEKFKAKRQFIISFGHGVELRLLRMHKTAVAESGTGTELVLVDRAKQVDDSMAGTRLRTSNVQGSHAGRNEGRSAGLNANTGGSSLGGQRAGIGS